jgi:hypothetical protein
MNVGVLAWSGEQHELAIDREAVLRIVRENPRLHPDALLGIESALRDRLGLDDQPPEGEIRERIADHPGFPVLMTEPLYTTVASADAVSLHDTVEHLVDRIVKPRHRAGRYQADLREQLAKSIGPLIRSGSVRQDHLFQKTRTGVPRRVDFFANSGRNLAVDRVIFDLKRADEIRLRADAEAYKATDIASQNSVRVLVLTSFSDAEEVQPSNDDARRILSSANVEVLESIEDVAVMLAS